MWNIVSQCHRCHWSHRCWFKSLLPFIHRWFFQVHLFIFCQFWRQPFYLCPSFWYRSPKVFQRYCKYSWFSFIIFQFVSGYVQLFIHLQLFPVNIIEMSRRFNDVSILRRLAAIVCISIIAASNLLDMYACGMATQNQPVNYFGHEIADILHLNASHAEHFNRSLDEHYFASTVCTHFPSYFSNFAILVLIATSIVSQLTHICKFCLMLVVAGKIRQKWKV